MKSSTITKIAFGLILVVIVVTGIRFWPAQVKVTSPHYGTAIQAVYATGVVEPSVTVAIAPKLAGHLSVIQVDEGDTVKKGQLLAKLYDRDVTSNLAELRAKLAFARSYFQRLQALNQRSLVAKLDFDKAKADLQAAEAAVDKADAQVDVMSLFSPADGMVIRRDAEIGQFVNNGQAIFQLSCCAPLRISAQIDEEDIAKVYQGQSVVLHTDNLPGVIMQATVAEITPKGDPVSRTYRVRMQLPDPGQLKIGMTVDTNLLVERHDQTLLIPSIAINKDKTVWVLENHRLHKQMIKTGITGEAQTEIIEGLTPQSQVVTSLDDSLQEAQWALVEP